MPSTFPNPIAELCRFIAASLGLARRTRRYVELLTLEAAEDIATDIVEHQRQLAAAAHKAETYDREALAALDAAMAPDSEGGVNITPNEQKKIRVFVAKSAELDHDTSEAAQLPAR